MAEDRKARLAALAARAGRGEAKRKPDADSDSNQGTGTPTVTFRNYVPADVTLEQEIPGGGNVEKPPAKRPRTDASSASKTTPKSALEEALEKAKKELKDNNAVVPKQAGAGVAPAPQHMAPKKVNWDLKRDIKSKLAKLEKRTQKAIVELLRERLEKEAEEENDGDEEAEDDLD